jgi:single-strand DNA-binding protein
VTELKLPEINRLVLAGRLTRDPDRRYGPDGTAITRFDLAFHRHYRTRAGQVGESSGFVTINTSQRLAEVCGEYLKKGSPVLVEGRLQMREWKAPQGESRNRLEVQADMVHFLERKPDAEQEQGSVADATTAAPIPKGRTRKHGERA